MIVFLKFQAILWNPSCILSKKFLSCAIHGKRLEANAAQSERDKQTTS